MSFVVYHIESLRYTVFQTAAAAKRSCTGQNKKKNRIAQEYATRYNDPQPEAVTTYAVASWEDFDTKINTWTETYNMLDPAKKPIKIRRSELGGCCDPATETYHCM